MSEYKHWCGNCQIKIYVQRHCGRILTWQDCPYTCEYAIAMRCSTEVKGEEDEHLISRQALCEYALNQKDKSVTPNDIMRFPSAQPERKTGKWIVVSDGYGNGEATAHICECSECKDTIWVYKKAPRRWNYCPNCGARMEGI